MSVAQALLERLKQNMVSTVKTPTKIKKKFKQTLTDRSGDMVKIDALMKQASSDLASNHFDRTPESIRQTEALPPEILSNR